MPAIHAIERPKPGAAPKKVSIMGATGSIGDSTLRVIEQHRDKYSIAALTAQDNAEKLIALAIKFKPALAAIGNEKHYQTVKNALLPHGIEVVAGTEGILQAAAMPCDISIAAIVGAAGLAPTMEAIKQGKHVALANKEALVCAGELVMQACKTHGATLLPVDSEHNAIFQVLNSSPLKEKEIGVEKITLTASGGPLLQRPLNTMHAVTPEEAINHPRWRMGAKISVDSATLINKGLELIEAHYLFNMPEEKLDVLIHPESIIHSLVHYQDGSVLAQLGMPDMAIPIAYALSWPNRLQVNTPRLNLAEMHALHFATPDATRFPALPLTRQALRNGPAHIIALNAANEIAVASFLHRKIIFTQIVDIVEKIVATTANSTISTVDDAITADAEARAKATELCNKR